MLGAVGFLLPIPSVELILGLSEGVALVRFPLLA